MKPTIRPLHKEMIFAFMAAALIVVSPPAGAQVQGQDCSNLAVNRSYSQEFGGFLNVPLYFNSPDFAIGLVPNAGAGFVTFLRDGKLSGRITLAIGGLGLDQDLTFTDMGSYDLHWETSKNPVVCAGSLSLAIHGVAQFDFQLLVTREGKQIEMIHTDTGLIVSVTGFPIETLGCGNQTVDGKYSENMRGWALEGGPLSFPPQQLLAGYFPFAASGAYELNAHMRPALADFPDTPADAGSVVAWDTGSLNGEIFQRTLTGWYNVRPDCTGMIVVRDPARNLDFHLEMFVGKGAGALYLVNVDTITPPGAPGPIPLYVLGTTLTRIEQTRD